MVLFKKKCKYCRVKIEKGVDVLIASDMIRKTLIEKIVKFVY